MSILGLGTLQYLHIVGVYSNGSIDNPRHAADVASSFGMSRSASSWLTTEIISRHRECLRQSGGSRRAVSELESIGGEPLEGSGSR